MSARFLGLLSLSLFEFCLNFFSSTVISLSFSISQKTFNKPSVAVSLKFSLFFYVVLLYFGSLRSIGLFGLEDKFSVAHLRSCFLL